MTTRRGFTLIELMVSLFLVVLFGAIVHRLLRAVHRSSHQQAEQSNLQMNVRTGGLIVPAELQELGYDSAQGVIGSAAITSDLLDISSANRVRFRAMRGVGITCAIATNELRIRKPVFGFREPAQGDSLLLFIERNQSLAIDDDWLRLAAATVDAGSTCGADPAIRIVLDTPIDGGLLSSIFVGGPLRIYQPMEFGLYTSNGRPWLGVRSAALAPYEPVLGPLAEDSGFTLSYLNSANNPTTDRKAVRSIEITLRGRSDEPVRGNTGSPALLNLNLTTRVALRNNLRP